jgi:tetratricopeptide (TPR) repeat protein
LTHFGACGYKSVTLEPTGGIVIVRTFLSFILAVVPCALASAQDWSELETLTFAPAPLSRSLDVLPVPGGPSGVPLEEPAAEFVVSRVRSALGDIESYQTENGPHALGLVPLLRELADIYHRLSDYDAAISVLERAQDIVRRWDGLDSLDQAEMVEEIIEINMAIARNEESIDEENHLRELVRRNPGDPRNVAILVNMAGRQMDVVRELLINGIPPEIAINVNVLNSGNSARFAPPRDARSMAASMLRRARASYSAAMREAIAMGSADISELFELETSVIDTYYLELINLRLRGGRQAYRGAGRLYFEGIGALDARLDNTRRFRDTPEAVTRALIELADWELMFGSFGHALGMYDEAAADLRANGGSEALVDAMFSPAVPVPLPALLSNAQIVGGRSDVQGYVDVEIDINRFGGVHQVRVTGRSDNATDSIERRLKRFVYQTRFRPRYVDGEWLRADRFALRYIFNYSTS